MPKKPASLNALPTTWKPAAGWVANSDHGFAGGFDDAGQHVDLVRLSDLIRWLEDAKRIPRSEAIQAVIDALPSDVMAWLYKITPEKRAVLVDANATFGQPTAESIAKAKEQKRQETLQRQWESSNNSFATSDWMVRDRLGLTSTTPIAQAEVTPVEPGRPALLQYLGKWVSFRPVRVLNGVQVDTLDWEKGILTYLAIPHAMAYTLFGWGTVDLAEFNSVSEDAPAQPKTYADLKRLYKAGRVPPWTPAMRKLLAQEEKRKKDAGHTGIRAAMAVDFGMTSSAIGQQITKAEDGTKTGRGRKAA
jgi:hypothetical protein